MDIIKYCCICMCFAMVFVCKNPAMAQDYTIKLPPSVETVDDNNVDLTSGSLSFSDSKVEIGESENRLFFYRKLTLSGLIPSAVGVINSDLGTDPQYEFDQLYESNSDYTVNLLGQSEVFWNVGSGEYFTENGASFNTGSELGTLENNFSSYKYTRSDGLVAIFSNDYADSPRYHGGIRSNSIYGAVGANRGRVISITWPDGYRWDFTYKQKISDNSFYASRIQSINDNRGYQLKFKYQLDDFNSSQGFPANGTSLIQWFRIVSVKAINNSVEYCNSSSDNCSLSNVWPEVMYTPPSGSDAIEISQGVTGGINKFTYYNMSYTIPWYPKSIFYDNETNPAKTYIIGSHDLAPTYVHSIATYVQSVTTPDGIWNYNITSVTGAGCPVPLSKCFKITRTNPKNNTLQIVTFLNSTRNGYTEPTGFPQSIIDENGNITTYNYTVVATGSGQKFNLTSINYPEGNKTNFTYNSRNKITSSIDVPKPGSGLSPLTSYATYPPSCTNLKICDKPITVTDPSGQVVVYSYDINHGGMLSQMSPPASPNGARPLKLITWTQRYAWIKNSSGFLVQMNYPIWVKSTETQCQTLVGSVPAATCDTSQDQKITTYEYGGSGTIDALRVKGVAISSGGQTLRTCYKYDIYGNIISTTQPNANISICS
jgi:hypothetical protein